MNCDLDMSWIEEYSRIHSIQQIMNREELDSIVVQTIYMNKNLEIEKIDKETVKLSNRCISKEHLLQIIQTKKMIEKTKYKLFDMILFTVDLDPKDIQKYVNGECNEIVQLKSIPIVSDITISPSLFIFHSLHTFFIFFTEITTDIQNIKSILKKSHPDNKKPKQTKKVRIAENGGPCGDHDPCSLDFAVRDKEGNARIQIPKKTRKIWNNT